MAYAVERYKTEEEWLANRGIGGSDAASIVDCNPWQSKWELYDRLTGDDPIKPVRNAVLQYGHDAEPIIRKLFAIDHPNMKTKAPKGYEMYRSDKSEYLTATIDGLTIDGEKRKGILEIKTHDARPSDKPEDWGHGNLPKNYIIQVLHYLLVLDDCEYVDFAVKIRFMKLDEHRIMRPYNTEIHYYHIERKDVEKELEWLAKAEQTFIEECLIPRKRPPIPTKINVAF